MSTKINTGLTGVTEKPLAAPSCLYEGHDLDPVRATSLAQTGGMLLEFAKRNRDKTVVVDGVGPVKVSYYAQQEAALAGPQVAGKPAPPPCLYGSKSAGFLFQPVDTDFTGDMFTIGNGTDDLPMVNVFGPIPKVDMLRGDNEDVPLKIGTGREHIFIDEAVDPRAAAIVEFAISGQ